MFGVTGSGDEGVTDETDTKIAGHCVIVAGRLTGAQIRSIVGPRRLLRSPTTRTSQPTAVRGPVQDFAYALRMPMMSTVPFWCASTDLSASWTSTPYAANPRDTEDTGALVACVDGRNADAHKVAEVHSPDYALGAAGISSEATSYLSQNDLDADIADVRSP
jgi:hypothetical protein